ncbi:MAG: glycerol kinase GlpK [Lachnospiraceae bacterium]|nr:glycerol kinase GlpK [Lachnospiraceae bacterium]
MKKYIMALDQGTTSSRCILFNKKGEVQSVAQREFKQIYPKPGWVEHDPMEIWSSQIGVAIEAAAKLGISFENVAGIGITNQRETTIVWNKKTGEPVYNAIVWQCRRTADMIDKIPADMKKKIRNRTGLIPDAYFSASKIKWILDNVKGAKTAAKKGDLLFGTVDTWIMWMLSGHKIHATDYTNASRTMLFDIKKLKWDEEILDYFGIPKSMMPEVHPSGYHYGYTDIAIASGEIPICGVAGDQQAALFGLCGFQKGDVKNTYGTGCFLLMNTGEKVIRSKNGLLSTIAANTENDPVQYVLEGSIFIGGAVVQWLRDEMEFIKKSPLSEKLATAVEDTAGGYLVHAFNVLFAPHWDKDERGTNVVVTRCFNKKHFVRAGLESIAYQTHDVIRAMEADAGYSLNSLKVDGGASQNNFLMQFQADIINTEIVRPKVVENTALGAAYLAGLTAGYWKDKDELKKYQKIGKVFEPEMSAKERKEKLDGWKKAVETAKFWSKLNSK